jgi:hypothetical protein
LASGIDFTRIRDLVEEREALISNASPEQSEVLAALQREIDDRLSKAGRRNRLQTIMGMMYESLERLHIELQQLQTAPDEARGPRALE